MDEQKQPFSSESEHLPSQPVTPVEPIAPAVPTAPIEPFAPAVPTAPIEPIAPAVPTAPIESTTLFAPDAPIEPIAPLEEPPYALFSTCETAQSSFSEHPGGNWTHPIEPMPATASPAYNVKAQNEQKIGTIKLIALLLCFSLLFSGISGFVGVWLGQRLAANHVASGAAGTTTVLWQTGPATSVPDGTTNNDALITAVEIARKSMVRISTETIVSGPFYGQSVQSGAGSGVIVTNDGYIVTNHHVIDGANTITVELETGESYVATLRGTDEETDLAVLKIDVTAPLTPVQWGRSEDLKVGQRVFAIGNPLGTLGGSVSDGIISALDREISVGGIPMTLLQTDTAVNPGNSGGGLFNLAGQLIGIVNAKYSDESLEGLGFAIPQKIAAMVTSDLIERGYVTGRPQLGLQLVNVTASNYSQVVAAYSALKPYIDDLNQPGIYVLKTDDATFVEGTIVLGDRLLAVDGKSVSSFDAIQTILRSHAINDEITIKVQRSSEGEPIEVEVKVRLTQKTITTPIS